MVTDPGSTPLHVYGTERAMRHLLLFVVFAILLTAGLQASHAQPANKAEAKAASNMRMISEYVDLGDYKAARKSLETTLGNLKTAGSAVRPIAAQVHVRLGVVLVLGFRDTKQATEQFGTAISIKQDIALPDFANDRAKLVFSRAYEALHPTIECDTLMGLFHKSVPLAQEGTPTVIEAKLDKLLLDGTMLVMYRGANGGAFSEAPMSKVEGCTFRGEIPADKVNAPKVEYYLESRLKDGRPAARKGKAKLPFVVNVSFGPIADAPEPAKNTEPVKEEVATVEPAKDEVEDLLLGGPNKPKGSGCAGCGVGGGAPLSGGLLALFALFGIRRRRRGEGARFL